MTRMTAQMIDMSSRFHNRPLMISDEIVDHLNRLGAHSMQIEDLSVQVNAMWVAVRSGERKPYKMEGSVAVIPVNGTLYHKVDWAGYSYTGYDWLNKLIDYAETDPDVKGVAFDFDSGGGEVDGAFETAEKIRKLGEKKPTMGMANGHAYSAAYLLMSATKKSVVTATGGVGSIGVVTSHLDVSEAMSEAGYKLTFIYKGKHKVDGNPYQPLPESVRKRIDAKLETPYTLLIDTVAKHRSMSTQAVRDTEALTFGAEEAKSLGLVDSVASPEEALAAFVAELNGKNWRSTMSANANEQTTADKNGNEVNQQALDTARAEGTKTGAADERARIMGILNLEEAKGREATARALCEQGMSVEQAKAVLATIPAATTETTASTSNHFQGAMDNTPNPDVTANAGGKDNDGEVPAHMKAITAFAKANGIPVEKVLN